MNKAELIKKLEDIEWEDFSLPRNPIIAKIFRFIRLAESIGSGFHKMIEGWEQHYGVEPVIEGDFDYYKITFPIIPVKDTVKDTARDTVKLSNNQKRIIDEMNKEPRITVDEISNLLDINLRNTKKNIAKLKELGFIKRVGPAKGGYWKVVEK